MYEMRCGQRGLPAHVTTHYTGLDWTGLTKNTPSPINRLWQSGNNNNSNNNNKLHICTWQNKVLR